MAAVEWWITTQSVMMNKNNTELKIEFAKFGNRAGNTASEQCGHLFSNKTYISKSALQQ